MKYYLGIDGGGTKTKLCLINEKNQVIGFHSAGPSSIDTVDIDVTERNIYNPYMLFKNELLDFEIESVFAGIGGITYEEDEKLVQQIISKLPHLSKNVKITAKNDMYNALYSGLLFEEGIALIVGTGSVAFGKDLDGGVHKCGGWGYKEGDAGSAYHLGKEALLLAVRAVDGRIESTKFTRELQKVTGINTIDDIVPTINSLWEERTKIASHAKVITKYANLGNITAINIVEKATDELALAVYGVDKNLNIRNKNIVIVGSLGNSNGYFREKLHKKIKSIVSDINIVAACVDPAEGAALMAKKIAE